MTAYLIEWLSLLGRWVHLITGIAWIGSSFYFVWLDNHLQTPASPQLRQGGVGGELWAVHGGGFYNAHKYQLAPAQLPPKLHWFYWEAYSTFLSGLFLLALMYYFQADLYLIDNNVAALSKPIAVLIGVSYLAGGWLVYDGLCRTRLAQRGLLLAIILTVLLSVAAWSLCQLFSGRGAFLQFGAMLGTIMVANVFFIIIPGQREMVRAKQDGREPDPQAAKRAKLRSVHNTYFTLPVLFTMLSNHYAMVFGARYNWLVLIALCLSGALIRAWFVMRHKASDRGGKTPLWPAATGLALLGTVIVWLSPAHPRQATGPASPQQAFAQARQIIQTRCVSCHAAHPTQPGIAEAPKGVMLETTDQILKQTTQMQQQLASHAMPIGNLTAMTEPEREQLLQWIADGTPH
jgi:uncharacterized membrane protein